MGTLVLDISADIDSLVSADDVEVGAVDSPPDKNDLTLWKQWSYCETNLSNLDFDKSESKVSVRSTKLSTFSTIGINSRLVLQGMGTILVLLVLVLNWNPVLGFLMQFLQVFPWFLSVRLVISLNKLHSFLFSLNGNSLCPYNFLLTSH